MINIRQKACHNLVLAIEIDDSNYFYLEIIDDLLIMLRTLALSLGVVQPRDALMSIDIKKSCFACTYQTFSFDYRK